MASKKKKVEAKDAEESRWFVIYCDEDSSYSLVQEDKIICEPDVKVSQKVSFFFDRKKPYTGKVAAIDNDYEAMKRKQNELNSKNESKRESSFHEGMVRKTKKKCIENIKSMSCNKTAALKPSSKHSANADKPKQVSTDDVELEDAFAFDSGPFNGKGDNIVNKIRISEKTTSPARSSREAVSDNDGDVESEHSKIGELTDQNDSDKSEELTLEEIELLEKIAKKKRNADIQALCKLSKKPKQEVSILAVGKRSLEKATENTIACVSAASVASSQHEPEELNTEPGDVSESESIPTPPLSPVQKKSKYRPKYEKKVFVGTFFLHTEKTPLVAEVTPKISHVFIEKKELESVKRGKTATEWARTLVPRIFTEAAIDECSVTGRPATGKGKELAFLRPPLHPDGVAAIYHFCKNRAFKKGLSEPSKFLINKAIGDVLNERRYFKKLRN